MTICIIEKILYFGNKNEFRTLLRKESGPAYFLSRNYQKPTKYLRLSLKFRQFFYTPILTLD